MKRFEESSSFLLFFLYLCDVRWRSFSANLSQKACCRRCSRSSLSFTFLLLLLLERNLQEVGDGGGVHHVAASQRRHQQERHRGSHAPVRDCPPQRLGLRPKTRPGEVASVPPGRRTSRGPLPHSALPPLLTPDEENCGGGPSPAPWQPSYGRDGAMPEAGDPCDVWRLQRCQPWHNSLGFHNKSATRELSWVKRLWRLWWWSFG